MFTNPRRNRASRLASAFRLIEIVIAMTILGMITGTLFSIILGSVKGAAQIEQVQRENDAINRFLDLCRKTFTTLPSTATLTLARLDPNAIESPQELTISGSPNCFGFGLRAISYEDTILGLRPDPNGLVDQNNALIQYLCLSREELMPETDASGQYVRPDVQTLCIGQAPSIAAVLLAAGAKGKRASLPNSRILIHQPWMSGLGGQATDIALAAKEILRQRERINEIMVTHTGQTVQRIQEDTERDYIMSPDEGKEYGIIDDVLRKRM